ncbi:MAG: peptidylprolyl isomerase [Solirubrobacteraceae bacterium]
MPSLVRRGCAPFGAVSRAVPPLVRRGCAPAGAAFVAVLALSACGGSSDHARSASTSTVRRVQTSSSRASIAAARSGCSEVEAPTPKGPQRIAKPTGKLDPSKAYLVSLETNCGSIEMKLAVKRAPRIAASFAYLVQAGFYDELTFHLVLPGYLIQGGDPEGNGSGGPGYHVIERPPAHIHYTPGTVAMAKTPTQPAGTAGSQFFIVVGKKVELPPQYALLGRVVKGWSTVETISRVHTEDDADGGDSSAPATPIVISHALLTTTG